MIGSWIGMLCVVILLPVLMFICGIIFVKRPPENINALYGYRTNMSMKNLDTWVYANRICGIIWKKMGMVLGFVSVILYCTISPLIGDLTISKCGIIAGSLSAVQLIFMIGTIFPIERALKKKFDSNGIERDLS